MTTIAQLLSQYYESVIDCDRIYHQNIESKNGRGNAEIRDSLLAKEAINLQRQVAQLTAELNIQKREADRIRELHKTQRALLESKLDNAKKAIIKLKRAGSELEDSGVKVIDNQQPKFHLLSPINRQTSFNGDSEKPVGTPSKKHLNGLRHIIHNGKPTLFDDDTSEFADKTDEGAFIDSLKNRDKLASIILPTGKLPSSADDNQVDHGIIEQKKQKKRRLIRKRIERTETDIKTNT